MPRAHRPVAAAVGQTLRSSLSHHDRRAAAAGAFVPEDFEEGFRHTFLATAQSGRVLEVSTVVPFHATMLGWWCAEGGGAIAFGSDAHDPAAVAHGFRDAVHLAEAHGFRAGKRPYDVWGRA